MKNTLGRAGWIACVGWTLCAFTQGCASSPPPVTAAEVRDGEALPPAPPVPEQAGAETAPPAKQADPPPEAPSAKEALSEAQIAKVSELVNSAEIEQATLAQRRAKAPGIKNFAAMMIKHHGDALREQAKLVKKLDLKAEDSATAATLKADGQGTLDALKKADAASFDAAYVQSQIDGHQKVLDLLDTQLLPGAKTPEVSDALRMARAMVEQHLRDARGLQTSR